MAQNRKQNAYKSRLKTEYIDGSTVRKLQTAQPYEIPERTRESEDEKSKRRAQQNKIRRANRVNFLYTVAVTAIVAVIFTICYQYLNLQASVKNNASEVANMQEQLNRITSENDENEMNINSSIDYNAIYDTAVNELGMVYPDKSQVINYNAGVSEYVKQYQDIPAQK